MAAASDGAKVISSLDACKSTSSGMSIEADALTVPDAVTTCSAAARVTGRRLSEASEPAAHSALMSSWVNPACPGLNVQYTGTLAFGPTLTVFSRGVRTSPFSTFSRTFISCGSSVRLWTVAKTLMLSPSVNVRGSIGQTMTGLKVRKLALAEPTCIFGDTAVTTTCQLVSESGSLNDTLALPVSSVRTVA